MVPAQVLKNYETVLTCYALHGFSASVRISLEFYKLRYILNLKNDTMYIVQIAAYVLASSRPSKFYKPVLIQLLNILKRFVYLAVLLGSLSLYIGNIAQVVFWYPLRHRSWFRLLTFLTRNNNSMFHNRLFLEQQ